MGCRRELVILIDKKKKKKTSGLPVPFDVLIFFNYYSIYIYGCMHKYLLYTVLMYMQLNLLNIVEAV